MPYRLRYHPEAKAELERCRETYSITKQLAKLDRWLNDLVNEAEAKEWNLSLSLESLLENTEAAEKIVRQWPTVRQRFWSASLIDKLHAVLVVVKTWRPPYESRVATKSFKMFLVDLEVTVFYLVDHTKKQIVIMQFDGLPMQGYA